MTHVADWSTRALCIEEDPETFFPHSDGIRSAGQIARARSICAECPVQTKCLSFALRANVEYGIWAGTTPRERVRMRRKADIPRQRRSLVVVRPKNRNAVLLAADSDR